MIRLPNRSVTRFFIPLIDVLTLLFCIFLLMPLVQVTGETNDVVRVSPQDGSAETVEAPFLPLDADPSALAKEDVLSHERDLQRLRAERIETLQKRLAIRVLEIDADTGRLHFQDAEGRTEIANEADARHLVDQHRRESVGQELYYLFLYPRRLTGFPQEKQVRQYQRWFAGVAQGFDNPRGGR